MTTGGHDGIVPRLLRSYRKMALGVVLQPPIYRRERYDYLVRGMIVNFLCLWMVCTRVTLIWSVLRGGKGSIRPKVRFENSAYGQGQGSKEQIIKSVLHNSNN